MKLAVDAMLGTLARHLRMCGYDAAYALNRDAEDDDALCDLARREGRVVLTRDRELAARAGDAVLVESKGIEGQLRELRDAGFDLSLGEPTRCGRCNARLEPVEGGGTPDYAPPPDEEAVWRCPDCGQHFWCGSHWDDVRERLSSL